MTSAKRRETVADVRGAARYVLAACLALPACKSERTVQHEALARSVAEPMILLCRTQHAEGGGCNRDCAARVLASEGRAAVRAARLFEALRPFADAETERLLVEVRKTAGEVAKRLGPACPQSFGPDAPVTDGLRRCADAKSENGPAIAALWAAVEGLQTGTEERTGVRLPGRPCKDG